MGTENEVTLDPRDAAQRRTLLQVLALNAGLSGGLLATGLAASSSGLIANALDNASDAVVYAISYFAVTRPQRWKTLAASISGILLLVMSLGVLADAIRRFVSGGEPIGTVMMVMAVVAATVNALCLKLLAHHRGADVNLRAAWTFSVNDFLSNFGILVAGGLVMALGRQWPDFAVGLAIAAVAAAGGVTILRDAARSRNAADPHSEHPHG